MHLPQLMALACVKLNKTNQFSQIALQLSPQSIPEPFLSSKIVTLYPLNKNCLFSYISYFAGEKVPEQKQLGEEDLF